MTTQEAVDYFGSIRELALALNISTQSVYKWRGEVPVTTACRLHVMTSGALKVSEEEAKAA